MHVKSLAMVVSALAVTGVAWTAGLAGQGRGNQPPDPTEELIRTLVGRLSLDDYKATIKGLTAFGDRREGTQRNRDAVDWIAAQLESYGCTPERMMYSPPAPRAGGAGGRQGQRAAGAGRGGQRAGGAGQRGTPPPPATVLEEPVRNSAGGSTLYGIRRRTGVNNNPEAQPDEALRALNAGAVMPGPFPQVYCTKVGATRPNEMYILGAHMDGIGLGEAANDDGSGTALVMLMAKVFSLPDVTTDVSIRFALWNGEEGGLRGARAYVAERAALQGVENPRGSGRYPEPTWLGMIQHDMMMWDHGMPRADGSVSRDQRPEADVNIEWQADSTFAEQSMK
ncbi:MAG TPA: M28 family peptidase, partial [Vicinamibacterales bacterium]|nr:M28 family peptidase [Vicinamibacterales bacterium]